MRHQRSTCSGLTCVALAAVTAALSGCNSGDDSPPPAPPTSSSSTISQGDCASIGRYAGSIATSISSAAVVQASASSPFSTPTNLLTPAPLQITTPFCRVIGVIKPSTNSNINFELWLPPTSQGWNGKFLGTADGGSMGAISYGTMTDPLSRGYAVMGHDNGHTSKNTYEQTWAFDFTTNTVKTDLITDFGYRAQHAVTVVSKEITTAFYAAALKHSYYGGCSQGGHHGMMEVQRYPLDYDGAIAGSHGGDWMGMMSSEAWAAVSSQKNSRAGALSQAQLVAMHSAVINACDANDGVVDGQMGDPRKCSFNPAVLACSAAGADPATCLSAAQVQSVQEIFAGPHRATGESVSPGYAPGSEGGWYYTWGAAANIQAGSYYDFFRLILKKNPNFDLTTLDWNVDIDDARIQYGSIYDAVSPDLSAFKANNGKLIMYHGWSDPLISPYLSLNYFTRLQDNMGQQPVHDFARLYMVPDMGHCFGGPEGTADWLTALEKWVEKGIPPDATGASDTIIGSGTTADGTARARPLCAYPQVTKYNGTGDVNKPESFTCVDPS